MRFEFAIATASVWEAVRADVLSNGSFRKRAGWWGVGSSSGTSSPGNGRSNGSSASISSPVAQTGAKRPFDALALSWRDEQGQQMASVPELLSAVKTPNHRDKLLDQTALFYAARHGTGPMVRRLLDQGADRCHRDQRGSDINPKTYYL